MARTMTAELREAPGRLVDNLNLRDSVVHGHAGMTPAGLAAVVIVWAGWSTIAALQPGERPPGTYQGFVKTAAAHSDRAAGVGCGGQCHHHHGRAIAAVRNRIPVVASRLDDELKHPLIICGEDSSDGQSERILRYQI